jgi:hypothetical protein
VDFGGPATADRICPDGLGEDIPVADPVAVTTQVMAGCWMGPSHKTCPVKRPGRERHAGRPETVDGLPRRLVDSTSKTESGIAASIEGEVLALPDATFRRTLNGVILSLPSRLS